MGVSRRAYAKHRGVSEKAVRKAIASGRINLEPDGSIDIANADVAWAGNSAPSMEETPKPIAPPPNSDADQKPVPKVATDIVRKTLLDAGLPAPPEDGVMSYVEARTANEILKAQDRQLDIEERTGTLVDRATAEELFFNSARQEREAWMQWPARAAALIAAELGVDPHLMETTLDAYVRKHLEDIADFWVEFR